MEREKAREENKWRATRAAREAFVAVGELLAGWLPCPRVPLA
jgi:hypothetical protein